MHDAFSTTRATSDYTESYIGWSSTLYDPPNVKHSYKLVRARLRDADATCARRAARPRSTRSSRRWTSSPYSMDIDPLELRLRNYAEEKKGKPFRARRCASATRRARSASAGRAAIRSRARCAKATSSSAGAWRPACGKRCAQAASARVVLTNDGQARSRGVPSPTSAPAPTRLSRRSRPTCWASRSRMSP